MLVGPVLGASPSFAHSRLRQIASQNDVDAIRAWLARFVDTRATFDTYPKESEHLLLWSTSELRKPLSSLTHEDLFIDRRFLAKPHLVQRWS
jgi:integrase/recombinase XerD